MTMCRICVFIVEKKSTRKEMRRIGQNTGMVRVSKKVQKMEIRNALVVAYLSDGHTHPRFHQRS